MPRSDNSVPVNPHRDVGLQEILGAPAPDPAVPTPKVETAEPVDASETVDASEKVDAGGDAEPADPIRRLTVDMPESVRRRFGAATHLRGLHMKDALGGFAAACARGDERALSLLDGVGEGGADG